MQNTCARTANHEKGIRSRREDLPGIIDRGIVHDGPAMRQYSPTRQDAGMRKDMIPNLRSCEFAPKPHVAVVALLSRVPAKFAHLNPQSRFARKR